MSAITHGFRFRFGSFCRQLFQKPARRAVTEHIVPVPVAATPPAPGAQPGDRGLTLPLPAVLTAFPAELRPKILPLDSQALNLIVPLEKVLPALARGVVRMSFGEIRRAAPQAFAPGSERDATQVILPLHEILSRLDPALLVRRPTQKKSQALPDEIASPFAGRGQGLTLGVGNLKPAPAADGPASEPRFTRKRGLPVAPAAPLPPGAPREMERSAAGSLAAGSISRGERIPFQRPATDDETLFLRKPVGLAPDTAPAPVPTPLVTPPPPSPPPPAKHYPAAPPVAHAIQPASAATVKPSLTNGDVLRFPLTAFLGAWPEAVRQEIAQSGLGSAQLAMPVELIEASLKRGRVVFAWKTLRAWIHPAAPPYPSAHGATELELPLSVVAPLFLARRNGTGRPPRRPVDESIPNLFFGLPKPEPAPTPKPADTNYYGWRQNTDNPRVEGASVPPKKLPGTDFLTKQPTPNEVVARAAALAGVAGVLIALPDGLLVAGRIPPECNGDTLAAFLPQVFAKVSQSTKELRLGDLNNLNFTVGNVPWKIFRVNALFFAAFGRAGTPLPTSELVRLAAELDRRR